MLLCINLVELKLHRLYIQCVFHVAYGTEKAVFFTELALTAFCPSNNNASQYSQQYHYSNWFCACTGQLVQHSLTVITINSSLTQCTAGADQMCTAVCAISCQLSTVHIVTQCDIKTTNITHTYHTLPQLTTILYNIHLY